MTTLDFNTYDEAKDMPNIRYIEFTNGNKLNLKREDPFGFWKVSFDKGQVPKFLQSAFTDISEALRAIDVYLKGKDYKIKLTTVGVEL